MKEHIINGLTYSHLFIIGFMFLISLSLVSLAVKVAQASYRWFQPLADHENYSKEMITKDY